MGEGVIEKGEISEGRKQREGEKGQYKEGQGKSGADTKSNLVISAPYRGGRGSAGKGGRGRETEVEEGIEERQRKG